MVRMLSSVLTAITGQLHLLMDNPRLGERCFGSEEKCGRSGKPVLRQATRLYTSDISKKSPIPEHQLCEGRRRRRKRRSERNRRRCTGEAVRRAVNVIALSPHRTGRVLLFTNGCPNHGPGTVLSVKQDRGGSAFSVCLAREK